MHFSKGLLTGYLFLHICCTGCTKFLAVDPPKDQLTTGSVFSNDSLAQDAVNGLYIKVMGSNQSLLNGGMSIYPALSADELLRTSFRSDDDQFYRNALTPDNGVILTNFWKPGYAAIYQANICLENLSKSPGISVATKQRLTGEVKFIRALCYWYLVNMFGDVPLVTTTDVDINMALPRSPAPVVYNQIIADLQEARSLLTDTGTNTKPRKSAATALLARAYCYLRQWPLAEDLSTAVINTGNYSLATDLNKVFVEESTETILQFAPVLTNNSTSEGYSFVPASSAVIPTYILTSSLLFSFEPNDLRKSWIRGMVINGQTYYHPWKYKVNATSGPATEYNIVLRLAEQYLIRAEAEAQSGSLPAATADINIIRNRAGLLPVSENISTDSCLAVIEQERRKEFFAEWGHRWFDLKRTNSINARLTITKGNNWQTTDQLYPIPLVEMQRNPALIQNDGY